MPNQSELEKRIAAARAAIHSQFGTSEDENGVSLFVSHHLEEIDKDYWITHLGSSQPEPIRVLDLLVLRSHWGPDDEEGLDNLDFTLPKDVTDYVLSVGFNDAGLVTGISMES